VQETVENKNELEQPVGVTADRQARSEKTVTCPITSYVTLGRDSKRVDIKTVFENNAGDHRLQVLFPTMLDTDVTVSETAFDVVERPIEVPLMADWTEPMPTVNPQNAFMDISDENCGITIANKGLHEFEPINDDARTVAVTLLRCTYGGVRGLDLHKDGQMYGTHSFEYSIIPHSGNWEESESYREAHVFNAPPAVGTCLEPRSEGLDWEDSFVGIDSRSFVLSAVKQAQDKDGFIIRGYNTGSEGESVELSFASPKSVTPADLKEEPVGDTATGETYTFDVPAKKIVTLRVK
jgi:alpha-mannosidase